MDETDLFMCDHHRCRLSKTACLKRQATEPRERFWGYGRAQAPPDFSYCRDGECQQGQLILLEHGGPLEVPNRNLKTKPIPDMELFKKTGYRVRFYNEISEWKRKLIDEMGA